MKKELNKKDLNLIMFLCDFWLENVTPYDFLCEDNSNELYKKEVEKVEKLKEKIKKGA